MPTRIKLLPEKIINKIAAGEVVERPASIVKELVENSIDAHSTKIKVEIKDGGKKLIKVIDNGEGLTRDDLFLAFERHATSKIEKFDDLLHIKTLGFRGEALPTIASISKIKARTKSDKCEIGSEIILEGGIVKKISDVAMNRGFGIEVRDIFYNVPARLKFLKKSTTEYFFIDHVLKRFLLSYPLIDFTIINNGKSRHFPKCKKLTNRIEQLYSEKVVKSLLPFSIEDHEFSIHGFVSSPNITSSTSYDINIFLNGRFIRDRIVYTAIKDAFKGKIFEKRFPYAFIYIEMSPDRVDVNVHPSKLEVKFQNEKRLYMLIKEALSTILVESTSYTINFESFKKEEKEEAFSKVKNFIKSSIEKYIPQKKEPIVYNGENLFIGENLDNIKEPKGFFSSLTVIGTFLDTFIILKNNENLLLLDQHAAHERIQIEKFKKQIVNNNVIIKKFLIPEILELNDRQKSLITTHMDKFLKLGFIIDNIDDKTFILKGIPAILEDVEYKELIEVLIEDFETKNTSLAVDYINEAVLAQIACKSALKAGTKLDDSHIENLLKELDNTPNNLTCPHGRPIIIEISKNEILRRFKRIT